MGARTSLRSSRRAASALMGASLVFNPAVFRAVFAFGFAALRKLVESEQDTQRLLNQVSHSFEVV